MIFKNKLLIFTMLICNISIAGPIWQAMELFEGGKFAEAAVVFEKHCQSSPFAYYYCQYLSEKGFLKAQETEAITQSENDEISRLVNRAKSAYQASIEYYNVKFGNKNKKTIGLNRLLSQAKNNNIG